MPFTRKVSIGALALGLVAALAWFALRPRADLSRTYRIGTDGVFPYHDLTAAGVPRGFVAEVLSEAARRAGVKLQWVRTNEKLDEALGRGSVDLWPLAGSDFVRRFPQFHASPPWLNNDFAFVALEPKFRDPANSSQVRRVTGRNSAGIRELAASQFKAAQFVASPDRRGAIEAVCRGEADGAIVELRVAHYFLAAPPGACTGKIPCFIGLTFRREQMSTASRAEFAAVADLLRDEIGRMADDGTLDRILLPWAYYQTEEVRAIFKVAQAESRYRWALGVSGALLLFGAGFCLQQRALYRARLLAESNSRENLAKTEVLRWVSHELRTPLNAVVSATTLLRQKANALSPDSVELLNMIQSSSAVLTRLVGDLLDAAQLLGRNGNAPPVRPAPMDLRNLLEEVGREFSLRARHQGLAFENSISGRFPEFVAGDAIRLRQVIGNLLTNSLHHTTRGYILLRAEWDGAGRLRVEVADSGTGIRLEDQGRIFSEFHRAPVSEDQQRGLGLGLPLSKGIIERMGGEIGFESTPGKGSTFWFEVPLEPAAARRAAAEPVVESGSDLRVLVVDDDKLNRVLLSRLMSSLQCRVESVENGLAAVSQAKQARYDLVLMDCWMPVMDGFEATRQIRESFGKSVFIAGCTANCLRSDIDRCFEAGMDDVIPKPVEMAKLRALVDSIRQTDVRGN